ncbi:hypothetical protein [uncultured Herbaspirillum sp.]|uniref:hypothetical protein n=1 Tax=uncultured Herbaspirillum sp. TaxID=160236 RepID=UPI0025883587|nr:hypothetical protein [uncultured Herbaspirillum sp.]
MKRKRCAPWVRTAMLASIVLTALPASAQIAEQTIREFTGCGSSFFSVLAQDAAASQTFPTLQRQGEIAWLKVQDRKTAPANQIDFSAAVTVGGMKLLGYFDEITDLKELGRYYYWGFIVEGTVEEVMAKLRPMVKDASRLQRVETDYARTELKTGSGEWLAINTAASSAPRKNTIERAFIVESMENNPRATRVSCSLQGSVTASVLQKERPDLSPAELPDS